MALMGLVSLRVILNRVLRKLSLNTCLNLNTLHPFTVIFSMNSKQEKGEKMY